MLIVSHFCKWLYFLCNLHTCNYINNSNSQLNSINLVVSVVLQLFLNPPLVLVWQLYIIHLTHKITNRHYHFGLVASYVHLHVKIFKCISYMCMHSCCLTQSWDRECIRAYAHIVKRQTILNAWFRCFLYVLVMTSWCKVLHFIIACTC